MSKNKNYIDNDIFETLIGEYVDGDKTHEEELMGMFDLLITNILNGFRFDVEEEDARQECFLLIIKILSNFHKERGSAFNYFTTSILNNLRLVYTKNKKYAEKIASYTEYKLGYNPSSS